MSTIEQLAQLVTKEGYAPVMLHPEVRRLCELVRADEREACAQIADQYMRDSEGISFGVGDAIRARRQA